LIKNLLRIGVNERRKIQEEIKKNLRNLGYYVKLEKKIWLEKEGKIDVFTQIEKKYQRICKKSAANEESKTFRGSRK